MNAIFCIYNHSLIGIDNKLPSQVIPGLSKKEAVKDDMSMFRHITKEATVVMGRKTWESMGSKPLPGRKMNLVITSDPQKMAKENPLYRFKDNVNFITKEQFERYYINTPNLWLIGGVQLLKEYLPKCEQIYLNELHCQDGFNTNSIESKRCTYFRWEEIVQLLIDNNFIDMNMRHSPFLASKCYHVDSNVSLYCYHFYKNYLNNWKHD